MGRVANVYYRDRLAGELAEDNSSNFTFTYDDSYLAGGVPISFRLPLREEPYKNAGLLPFFENLVAEGWLKKLQSQHQRIDEHDRFGLLLANGKDLVGAVTVKPKAPKDGEAK